MDGVEAVAVTALLDDCCEKLSFLGIISPDVNEHKAEESTRIGDEMSRLIREQRELEARFEQLISLRSQLKANNNKTRYKENQEEIKEVAKALKQSTKVLCRNLKDNPNVAENLMKLQGDRKQLENMLRLTIDELRDGCHFSTLDDKVGEDQAEYERTENKKKREQEATLAVKTLQESLEEEQNLHASEVTEMNAIISNLKDSLHQLRSTTSFTGKLATNKNAAAIQCQVRLYLKEETGMSGEIDGLKAEIAKETRVHSEMMAFLEKKRKELVEKSAFWEEKDVADKNAMQEKLDKIEADRSEDFIKVTEYEERKQIAEAEREAREAEEKRQRELEEMQRLEKMAHDKACTQIQAAWRGYMVQNAGKKAGKKGKKGKGKGKKGKKKK